MTADSALGELLRDLARRLNVRRALAALDLETTGVNPDVDRIVEVTIARVEPDTLNHQIMHARLNPGIPIPAESTAVHGIRDQDVATAPVFRTVAPMVTALLSAADLVGFNHRRFDVRMIAAECRRINRDNPTEGARLIDAQLIFHKREPRDLEAAVRFFCGEAHAAAHGTTADVAATLRVLLAQLERYPDLPRDVEALDALGRDPSFIDRDGKFVWRSGQACVGFGKHQGVPLAVVDDGFLRWMLDKDFPIDAKAIAQEALRGKYPAPPAAAVASQVGVEAATT